MNVQAFPVNPRHEMQHILAHYTSERAPHELRWLLTAAMASRSCVSLVWFHVDDICGGIVQPLTFEGEAVRVRTETGRETTIALWDVASADVIESDQWMSADGMPNLYADGGDA